MFYRRKIILALLQFYNGQLDKICLQKLLFLFCQRQAEAVYDFVPYKMGCYSFSANADLTTMVKRGLLSESNTHFKSLGKLDYVKTLKESDRKLMEETIRLYGKMNAQALMRHTYLNYPYWAINSELKEKILSTRELQNVISHKGKGTDVVLYTIGYEGVSIETYLNKLLKNDVKVLVDVRNNPSSMKYGFSKKRLHNFCNALGIEYIHFPDLGIQSEQRRELKDQNDYDALFAVYRKDNLENTTESQLKILELMEEHQRIALTCFEADVCQCHRKHLAEAIAELPGFNYKVTHI